MRQFDVFVFDEPGKDFDLWKPTFTDPALGWFHTNHWNNELENIEAEWVIFAHPSILIDREFLNELAQETDAFPMVDAFAPRVKFNDKFYGGLVVNGKSGFSMIDENEKLRFVAAPNPLIGVYSSRIIQRTGFFDTTIPNEFRLADYTLRMAHAGGKMFSVPYLVARGADSLPAHIASGKFLEDKTSIKPLWNIIYMTLPAGNLLNFAAHHPTSLSNIIAPKELKIKRDKATDLSKLTPEYLKEISWK